MENSKSSSKLAVKLDLRLVCLLLLLIIGGMLAAWQPWNDSGKNSSRKITITGQATIKAEPDQYQFSPYYERDTTAEVTALNDQIIKGLNNLGVSDAQIKNNVSKFNKPQFSPEVPGGDQEKVNLSLTITLPNKDLVQKVQDYLVTTNPNGSITPYPSFSTQQQKELTDRARGQAISDAKQRADKTASGLDARIGKVLEISEVQPGGGVFPYLTGNQSEPSIATDGGAAESSIAVQPGENEFSYSVKVTFALK